MIDTVPLNEIATIQTGPFGSQLHQKDYVLQGTPIVTVEHLGQRIFSTQNLPYVSNDDVLRLRKYQMKQGDIIFSRVGSVDRCSYAQANNDGWLFSGRCLRVRVKQGISSSFLYYWLSSVGVRKFIRGIAVGATMPSINTTLLGEIPVPLLPLDIQNRIAQILEMVDKKISINQQINDYLEELLIARFSILFEGPVAANWPLGMISDIGNVVGGATPSKARKDFFCEQGISWITPRDLANNSNKFVAHGAIDITKEGYESCSTKILPTGSILFSSRAPVGYVAVASNDVTTNQGFKSVVPKPEYGTAFVYCFLKRNAKRIEGAGSGTTFIEVSGTTMKNIDIKLPPVDICKDFEAWSNPILRQQKLLETEIDYLEKMRDSLLPKLMSGEIDVSQVDLMPLNYHL